MSSDYGRKVFVGGLHMDTTDESMKHYFESYGTVEISKVMRDMSSKSRGFGFVTFSEAEEANKAIIEHEHILDGKTVEVKMAVPKGQESSSSGGSSRQKKLFLGGLSTETTKEQVEEILNALIVSSSKHRGYSTVTIHIDKETQKSRGFGFALIEPESESETTAYDIVDDILKAQTYVKIDGRDVELKHAIPREDMKPNQSNQYRGDSRGYADFGYGRGGGGVGMDRMMGSRNSYDMPQGYSYPNQYEMYQRMRDYAAYTQSAMSSAVPDRGYGYESSAMSDYSKYWNAAYAQSGSNYGPTRGTYGDYKDTRERGDGRPASYHPYTRRQ